MSRRRKILSVSSGRADIGIIAPVWRALAASEVLDLHIVLTGTHARDDAYARSAAPEGATITVTGKDISGTRDLDAQRLLARIESGCAETIVREAPDILLVVGDRIDMYPAVTASIPFNLPIAHIAGGDLSFGALDERLRHAMTKLSHLHFVLNRHSAGRVAAMGEERWRIHVVGAPNLDTLVDVERMTADGFLAEFGLPTLKRLRLVTLHPETNSEAYDAPLDAVLEALDRHGDPTLLTAPNADAGGGDMDARIRAFAAERPWAVYRDTLGSYLYANAMRLATTMIGNSASGVIEAGLFGLQVINVGTRQQGRETGPNVHHCPNDVDAVAALMHRLTEPASDSSSGNLYGDGKAAARIRGFLEQAPDRPTLLYKRFDATEPGGFAEPWNQAPAAA